MSVEALGSIAVGVGEAVSAAPALGAGAGGVASLAGSGVEASGGSFAAGLNAASLFSETVPFTASVGAVPEMAPANAGDVFSSSWQTLAEAPKSLSTVEPVVKPPDVFNGLGFESFSGHIASVPERPIANPNEIFSQSSWITIGKAKETAAGLVSDAAPEPPGAVENTNAENLNLNIAAIPETAEETQIKEEEWLTIAEKPQEAEFLPGEVSIQPEGAVAQGLSDLQAEGLQVLLESAVAGEAVQAQAAETLEQNRLAEKVVGLLVETGVSATESEARKRVGAIVLEQGELSEDAVGRVKTEMVMATALKTEARVQPITETNSERAKIETEVTQVGIQTEDKREKPELKKLSEQAPVVDEVAQANRKKTAGEIISALFGRARRESVQRVDSQEVADGLERKSENKSFLLTQLMVPHLPDGSLEEAAGAVESLGDLQADFSKENENRILSRVDKILDEHVPVKISDSTAKRVSVKEVKEVLKHAMGNNVLV